MKYKYGNLTKAQILSIKKFLRKSIFFLLLYVDPATKQDYSYIDVNEAFVNLLYKMGGLNSMLINCIEITIAMTLIEEAKLQYNSVSFDYQVYRKLILDAGAEIEKIKEV